MLGIRITRFLMSLPLELLKNLPAFSRVISACVSAWYLEKKTTLQIEDIFSHSKLDKKSRGIGTNMFKENTVILRIYFVMSCLWLDIHMNMKD